VSGREERDLVIAQHTERCMLLLQERIVVARKWKLATDHVEAVIVQSESGINNQHVQ